MENFEITFKAALKPKPMPGLSQRQIDDHFDVKYKGYITKFNEIQTKLKGADKKGANPNYSEVRELMVERLFNHNSIKLHEAYWQCLSGAGEPPNALKKMIDEDFGSYNAWKEEFKACGLEARGWAILGFDMDSGRLFNFVTDAHMIAPINVVGLMIMDMYEHAYYIDYGSTVKRYVEEGFLPNMSWNYAAQAIERYHVPQHRQELLKKAA
ncbi:MAG TPA: Fe-Mn family superoxide dismutase [Candidatus Manganitrophaceae bacterium]|nr:Fe-Mn family superoxide dismutase [Candidatus Manganitrophaceae bacterium]